MVFWVVTAGFGYADSDFLASKSERSYGEYSSGKVSGHYHAARQAENEKFRTWTSEKGQHQFEGRWLGWTEDKKYIRLQNRDGKIVNVELKKLSQQDQNYVSTRKIFPDEDISPAANDPFIHGNRYALLVGIDDYEDKNQVDLGFAVKDILLLGDQLARMGFKRDHIYTFRTLASADRLPLKRLILDKLKDILNRVGPDDMICLAFAGHGVQIKGKSYFCTQDTDFTSEERIASTAISIMEIADKLARSKARCKLLITDACRNNIVNTAGSHPFELPETPGLKGKDLIIFQSCASGQVSFENNSLEHGLFTWYLVQGLRGAADTDRDGTLKLLDVLSYTIEKTRDESRKIYDKPQVPYYYSGDSTDLVLYENKRLQKAHELVREAKLVRDTVPKKAAEYFKKALSLCTELNNETIFSHKSDEECSLCEEWYDKQMLRDWQWELDMLLGLIHGGMDIGAEGDETEPRNQPRQDNRALKQVNGIDYPFRWCPPGKFKMGGNASSVERAAHDVTLSKGFWILETEVTQEMWQNVMTEKGNMKETIQEKAQLLRYQSDLKIVGEGNKYPMYYVTWEECQEFCERLSRMMGLRVTLPSEAQWEYACRAGTNGDYAGKNIDSMAWYAANSIKETHPVARKSPNNWGIYDMHGNVAEWCADHFVPSFKPEPCTDPLVREPTAERTIRGGAWNNDKSYCRSAIRYGKEKDYRYSNLGFRIVIAE